MTAWQDIATAPKGKRLCNDGADREQYVIVWSAGCRFARQDENGQWRGVIGRPLTTKPTHWMPLPEPPK